MQKQNFKTIILVCALLLGVLPSAALADTTSTRQALDQLQSFAPALGASGITGSAQTTGLPANHPVALACAANGTDPTAVMLIPGPLGVAPSGSDDGMSTPDSASEPSNPVVKACENGRIIIRVETPRFYAHHIGDEIPISIQILADDGVKFNFASLLQDILAFDGSSFILIPVRKIEIASHPATDRPHATLYGIDLSVQSFVPADAYFQSRPALCHRRSTRRDATQLAVADHTRLPDHHLACGRQP